MSTSGAPGDLKTLKRFHAHHLVLLQVAAYRMTDGQTASEVVQPACPTAIQRTALGFQPVEYRHLATPGQRTPVLKIQGSRSRSNRASLLSSSFCFWSQNGNYYHSILSPSYESSQAGRSSSKIAATSYLPSRLLPPFTSYILFLLFL